MKVSNFFLILWWLDHHKEEGFMDHLEGMAEMDTEQSIFASGLPKSGRSLASEAIESFGESIASLTDQFKTMFMNDAPATSRNKVKSEIEALKTKRMMTREFITELDYGNYGS